MKKNLEQDTLWKALVSQRDPQSHIAEQYRMIETSLSLIAGDVRPSILVTAANSDQGTTVTAVNLAVTMAMKEKKTLLVDLNLRRPMLQHIFGLDRHTKGLTSVLTHQASFEECVARTSVPYLNVVTSGPSPDSHPANIFRTDDIEQFLQKSREAYDITLLDGPALLESSEVQWIAGRCTGTVLVMSSGITRQEVALKAKERLLTSKTHIYGVIINNCDD